MNKGREQIESLNRFVGSYPEFFSAGSIFSCEESQGIEWTNTLGIFLEGKLKALADKIETTQNFVEFPRIVTTLK